MGVELVAYKRGGQQTLPYRTVYSSLSAGTAARMPPRMSWKRFQVVGYVRQVDMLLLAASAAASPPFRNPGNLMLSVQQTAASERRGNNLKE